MVMIDGVVYAEGGKTDRDTLPRKKKMHLLKRIRKHLGLGKYKKKLHKYAQYINLYSKG